MSKFDEIDDDNVQLKEFLNSGINTNTTGLGGFALKQFVDNGGLFWWSNRYADEFISFLYGFVINDVFDGKYNIDDEYKKSILNAIVKGMLDELGLKE